MQLYRTHQFIPGAGEGALAILALE